jgi:pimeloyl-ACP methyl ester carboxylesterase
VAFAINDGVRIHYETVGAGPTIILLHGSMADANDWIDAGYVDMLKDEFRLILVDGRGHGRSDKPHDAVLYRMETLAADVVAMADHAGVERPAFLGYSWGGGVGFAIAKYYPKRFSALILGGASPISPTPERIATMSSVFQ